MEDEDKVTYRQEPAKYKRTISQAHIWEARNQLKFESFDKNLKCETFNTTNISLMDKQMEGALSEKTDWRQTRIH